MNRTWLVILAGLLLVGIVGTAVYLRSRGGEGSQRTELEKTEDPLDQARETLRRTRDLTSCRGALQQVNLHLGQNAANRPKPLASEQRQQLQNLLQLDQGELAELDSTTFTLLDGPHLEQCFLLHDAALSLPPASKADQVSDGGAAPQDTAAIAFGWVMRQIRLERAETDQGNLATRALSPQFVLRRGWGSPLERSLVFLALIEQLGLEGCLVVLPGESAKYWACGVLGADDQLYLFDARLGMPLPGPQGKGIATLEQVEKDPAVLAQLKGKQPYDITAEQAARSELLLPVTLSALAPRMRTLQDNLLAPAVVVKLASDPLALRARLRKVHRQGNKEESVRVARWTVGLQRRFLPPDEGGTDALQRRAQAMLELAPMHVLLAAIPSEVRPRTVLELVVPPMRQLADLFASAFISFPLQPRQPRDLVLRGRLEEAIRELGIQYEKLKSQRSSMQTDLNKKKIIEWVEQARAAHADLLRAERRGDREAVMAAKSRIDAIWRLYDKPLAAVVLGSAADPLLAQVIHLRTLAQQEQAERLQARLARSVEPPRPEDLKRLHDDWQDVLSWWGTYLSQYSLGNEVIAVRLLRAQAFQALYELSLLEMQHSPEAQRPAMLQTVHQARQRAAAAWEETARELEREADQQPGDLQLLQCRYWANWLQR